MTHTMFISKGYINVLTGGFLIILLKRIITFLFYAYTFCINIPKWNTVVGVRGPNGAI